MSHALIEGKKTYYRERGENWEPREVIAICEEDICPVCQWPFGSKKTYLHTDGALTHDRPKCRDTYIQMLNETNYD